MEVTNVNEYEAIAKQKLPKMAYDYYASGAEDQWTLAENRNAFSRILWAFLFCSFIGLMCMCPFLCSNNLHINTGFAHEFLLM